MVLIGYKKCSTCLKAISFLEENKVSYTFRDIKDDNPSEKELSEFSRISSIPLSKMFNTSGLLYRELNLKDKIKTMTEKQMLQTLASDGMLVKRPILVGKDFVLFGFKEDSWNEHIISKR